MDAETWLKVIGICAIPGALLIWWMLRMSWTISKRDSVIDGLSRSLDLLKERVDEHDDLRERMARMEQALHDTRGSLQRIETALRVRQVGGSAD